MPNRSALIAINSLTDGDALAGALADAVEQAIVSRLARGPKAAIALSGGRTPARFMAALAARDLPWADVIVTLVDERWVPESSPRSNAALLRLNLLRGPAAAATFLPLWRPTDRPEPALAALQAEIAALPLPLAAVVLGMGDDGHTASFFPGGDQLAAATSPTCPDLVLPMRAPAAGEPRITLTLPPLIAADALFLHIEGAGKRDVLDKAIAGDDAAEMPVRAVLHSGRALQVYWCP